MAELANTTIYGDLTVYGNLQYMEKLQNAQGTELSSENGIGSAEVENFTITAGKNISLSASEEIYFNIDNKGYKLSDLLQPYNISQLEEDTFSSVKYLQTSATQYYVKKDDNSKFFNFYTLPLNPLLPLDSSAKGFFLQTGIEDGLNGYFLRGGDNNIFCMDYCNGLDRNYKMDGSKNIEIFKITSNFNLAENPEQKIEINNYKVMANMLEVNNLTFDLNNTFIKNGQTSNNFANTIKTLLPKMKIENTNTASEQTNKIDIPDNNNSIVFSLKDLLFPNLDFGWYAKNIMVPSATFLGGSATYGNVDTHLKLTSKINSDGNISNVPSESSGHSFQEVLEKLLTNSQAKKELYKSINALSYMVLADFLGYFSISQLVNNNSVAQRPQDRTGIYEYLRPLFEKCKLPTEQTGNTSLKRMIENFLGGNN